MTALRRCVQTLLATVFLVNMSPVLGRRPNDINLPLICQQTIGPGKGILINESVVLTDNGLSIDEVCNITLATARSDNRVLINIIGFAFGPTCENGSMEIYDYKSQESITGKLCGMKLDTKIYKSRSRALSLVVTPPADNSSLETVFQLIFTSFNMGKDGKCAQNEFQCDNKLCIAADLYCNGYNECSDNSDEPSSCGIIVHDEPTPIYVWIIIAVVIVAIAAIVVTIILFKVLKHRRQTPPYERTT